MTSCVVFSFYLQPYLTGGDLPVSVYIPDGWYYYIHFGFWPLAPCIVASIYGSDALFCAISVPVIVQFKLLAHKIESWRIEKTQTTQIQSQKEFKDNLKSLVDHQNFLFEYCNKVNKFNNAIFLNQFLLSVGIICVQLFVVSQKYHLSYFVENFYTLVSFQRVQTAQQAQMYGLLLYGDYRNCDLLLQR